jgi:hypothetical protein
VEKEGERDRVRPCLVLCLVEFVLAALSALRRFRLVLPTEVTDTVSLSDRDSQSSSVKVDESLSWLSS